jgi:hypothetical protein
LRNPKALEIVPTASLSLSLKKKKKFQQPITFYVCANVYSMSNLEPDPHAFRKREKLTRNYGVLFLSHA